jgi:hypothetical protein
MTSPPRGTLARRAERTDRSSARATDAITPSGATDEGRRLGTMSRARSLAATTK